MKKYFENFFGIKKINNQELINNNLLKDYRSLKKAKEEYDQMLFDLKDLNREESIKEYNSDTVVISNILILEQAEKKFSKVLFELENLIAKKNDCDNVSNEEIIKIQSLVPSKEGFVGLNRSIIDEKFSYFVVNNDSVALEMDSRLLLSAAEMKKQELINLIDKILKDLVPEKIKNLIRNEKEKLEKFFGMKIDVSPLPKEITKYRIEKWEKQGFELHYLPEMKIIDNGGILNCPGLVNKPSVLAYYIQNGNVDKESGILYSGWLLIDRRLAPDYKEGWQMYKSDVLAEIISKLRRNHKITWSNYNMKSRFYLTWKDINSSDVKKAFANVLGVEAMQIDLPRAIEWNVIGNLHYPEWVDVREVHEWLKDSYKHDSNNWEYVLYTGDGYYLNDLVSIDLGFRLVVRFRE